MFCASFFQVAAFIAWAMTCSATTAQQFGVIFTSDNSTVDSLSLTFIRNPGLSAKGGLVAEYAGPMGRKGITWSIQNSTYLAHYNEVEPAAYGFIHLTTKQPKNVPKGYLYAEYSFIDETPGFSANPKAGYTPLHFDPSVSGVNWKTFAVCSNDDYRSTGQKVLQVLYRGVGSVPDKTGQCADIKLNAVLYF